MNCHLAVFLACHALQFRLFYNMDSVKVGGETNVNIDLARKPGPCYLPLSRTKTLSLSKTDVIRCAIAMIVHSRNCCFKVS